MADYTELVKGLREHAERFDYDGWIDTAIWFEQAADVIDKLSKQVDDSIPKSDAEIIIAEVAKPRWIPVTERLPEPGVPCLCWCKGGTFGQIRWYGLYYLTRYRTWAIYDNDYGNQEVTHWMYRPEPPKEE